MSYKRRPMADIIKIKRMDAARILATEYGVPFREVYALLERMPEAEVRRHIEQRSLPKAA